MELLEGNIASGSASANSKKPQRPLLKSNMNVDQVGHYDIDGASYGEGEVVIASSSPDH